MPLEYEIKEREKRTDNHIPADEPILFFEVTPGDASEFSGVLQIQGRRSMASACCEPSHLRYPMLSPRSCCSCAMKRANYLTCILAGAKAIRCPIC